MDSYKFNISFPQGAEEKLSYKIPGVQQNKREVIRMRANADIPLGFAAALSQDTAAAQAFYALPEAQRMQILKRARSAASKSQMRALVRELSD